jgi:hypothetical protein
MSSQNRLDELLARVRNVYSLAGDLCKVFEEESHSWKRTDEQARWSRYAATLDQLKESLQELTGPMLNPPDGFGAVAHQLLQAVELVDHLLNGLSRSDEAIDYFVCFRDLDLICKNGLESVARTEKSGQVEEMGRIRAGKEFLGLLEDDPEAVVELARTQKKLKAFAAAIEAVMSLPEYQAINEIERKGLQEMAESLRAASEATANELAARHFPRPRSLDDWEHIALIAEVPMEKVLSGKWTIREIRACALAWADRQTIKARLSGAGERAGELEIAQEGASVKRSGRKKADFETIQKEAELAAAWKRAREVGVYKADFARDCKIAVSRLDALLDRVAKRNQLSE